ncbi:hypothetical protein EG833_01415 [archaeon]|nr:hypothetical protein [archaeon]
MSMRKTVFTAVIFSCLFVFLVSGCSEKSVVSGSIDKPKVALTTEYQAVFLDNGQAFFGKLENPDSTYPLLKEVFYIQRQVNQETKEVKNILIKRGSEWHAPDQMHINSSHIVLIEPVGPNSQVAKLIKEAKAQAPAATQQ